MQWVKLLFCATVTIAFYLVCAHNIQMHPYITCTLPTHTNSKLPLHLFGLYSVYSGSKFFDLQWKFRLSLFSHILGYLDAMNGKPCYVRVVSVHEMENRFRITFAFAFEKRLQTDFWIIEWREFELNAMEYICME